MLPCQHIMGEIQALTGKLSAVGLFMKSHKHFNIPTLTTLWVAKWYRIGHGKSRCCRDARYVCITIVQIKGNTYVRYMDLLSSQLLEDFRYSYLVSTKAAEYQQVPATKAACVPLPKLKSECRDQNLALRMKTDSVKHPYNSRIAS